MIDQTQLKYGLFADAPDLLDILPALGKLKTKVPSYIQRAENAQKIARKFARNEIFPKVLETDSKCGKDPKYVDWDLWKKANKAKLTISPIPEKMGGLGWSALDNATLIEEIASVCLASASNITFNTFGLLGALVECQTGLVVRIIREMVEAQKQEKPLFWSWAITEPSAGTDMEDPEAMGTMRPSTDAKKVSGGYLLNGTKCFITNGSLADYVIATIPMDRVNPRESMATFLVPATANGFKVGRIERKCGQKASQTAELYFDNVFVPDENLMEPPGRGLRHTREILSITRGFIGLAGLGLARGTLERCVQFAYHKQVKGHRLIDDDWVQMAIADMLKDIMAVRGSCYNFAIALDTYHAWSLFDKVPVKASLAVLPEKVLLSESLQALTGTRVISEIGSKYKKKIVSNIVYQMT